MNTNTDFYKDCFTEIEDGKINAEFNKATLKCFDSQDNKFSMDCEGNLVVNSIITREGNNSDNTSFSIDSVYPVGSIYMSVTNINPSTAFGGTWEQIQGRFLLGVDDNHSNGSTGGEEMHTLSSSEMPSHNHTGSTDGAGNHTHQVPWISSAWQRPATSGNNWCIPGSGGSLYDTAENGWHAHSFTTTASGGNAAHNNMPPYLAVYIWKRVS